MNASEVTNQMIGIITAFTGAFTDVKVPEYNINMTQEVTSTEIAPVQQELPDKPPYYENTQEYDAYVERLNRGKIVGLWGAGMTWQYAAQSTNVPLSYTPEVGATCLDKNMLYTVVGFDGSTLKLKNHLETTERQFIEGQCLFIL